MDAKITVLTIPGQPPIVWDVARAEWQSDLYAGLDSTRVQADAWERVIKAAGGAAHIARELGVSPVTVYRWRRQERHPKAIYIRDGLARLIRERGGRHER